ncbi:hypothetical protein NC652_011353 [Populus alba x Populus x berolinensis]|nr:hypothetical protein NC652_011353 [Populus alba x Populus x berolinensis]
MTGSSHSRNVDLGSTKRQASW